MSKEDLLEFDGTVTEVLPDGNFRVKLDNDHVLLAYMSGKMRKFRIRTGVGDRVVIHPAAADHAPAMMPPSLRKPQSGRSRNGRAELPRSPS
jgi:translation initiation factor IF-1